MSSPVKLAAGTPQVLTASGTAITSGSVGSAGTDLDNTTVLALSYDFELSAAFGGSVLALANLDLWLVPKMDGTDAAAVDASGAVVQYDHFVGRFVTPTTGTTARRLTVQGVQLGPYKYTAYIFNQTAQTLSTGWMLTAYPVNKTVG